MKLNKKIIITAIVTIVMAIAGAFFGINYTDEDIKEISEGVETVVDIIAENKSTTEIPEAYIEDEVALEEQEVESEAFELQGEIAYNGTAEIPTVNVGEYAGLTYYSQIDNRWKNKLYTSVGDTTQTIGSSGCGPTCGAMVVSSIRGNILPDEMADLYVRYGYRSANNGTYWSAFRFTADVFDIEYTEKYKLNDAVELLKDNHIIIVSCGNGLFTTGGHFIVICGIEGDTLKIYDPYLYSGKFNTSTRRGKVEVEGNTVYCSVENFREYANYSCFFAFKNDNANKEIPAVTPAPTPIVYSYTRYVKVNSSLNVRSGAGTNYKYIRSLYNRDMVTVFEEKGNWSRIGDNEWVCSDYLTDSNVVIKNTVGQVKKFKANTTLYSNSNLTGTQYQYLKNTSVVILQNVSTNVDKIKVRQTGRVAYVNISSYR
ncbi:MAG: C39 family peptidase [Clostridia bacterium]|nr:C39 family peptidase [Clostridia bacterium]